MLHNEQSLMRVTDFVIFFRRAMKSHFLLPLSLCKIRTFRSQLSESSKCMLKYTNSVYEWRIDRHKHYGLQCVRWILKPISIKTKEIPTPDKFKSSTWSTWKSTKTKRPLQLEVTPLEPLRVALPPKSLATASNRLPTHQSEPPFPQSELTFH